MMSLRVKLTLFMLVVSLFPMLLYGAISYSRVRDSALDKAVETSAALFQSKVDSYEQKVQRLYNTTIDINSNTWLRFLFKSIKDNPMSDDTTTFQKWQIISNSTAVERTMDAHFAAQRDVLNGIGLIVAGRSYASLKFGTLNISQDAVDDSLENIGVPRLRMNMTGLGPLYSICLSFGADASEPLGTCMLDVNGERLFETLMPSNLMEGERLFVLDEQGDIIFHPEERMIGTRYQDVDLLMSASESARQSYLANLDGQVFIVTCQRTATNADWTVYYAVPYSYFVQSGSSAANLILPFALLCALMAILAALISSWNVYAPIRRLTRAISNMSGRNLKPLKPHGNLSEITLLMDSFNRLMEDINSLLHQVEVEAENTKKAEIIALRAQVSPHFLYNTLNVIKVLAAQNRTGEIQIAVTSLIDLLRASIGDARDVVPLSTELGYVENYVLLQHYRLDLHFDYRVDIDERDGHWAVPHFTLQPLVENALLHAFSHITNDENRIEVRARQQDGELILTVEDNGDGINPDVCATLNEQLQGESRVWMNKVGLHNVSERAIHLFGPTARLQIENTHTGTKLTLRLPAIPYASGQDSYRPIR